VTSAASFINDKSRSNAGFIAATASATADGTLLAVMEASLSVLLIFLFPLLFIDLPCFVGLSSGLFESVENTGEPGLLSLIMNSSIGRIGPRSESRKLRAGSRLSAKSSYKR
jgi:hypothetical protein